MQFRQSFPHNHNKDKCTLWHPFLEHFAKYLQLFNAAMAFWLLVLLLLGSAIVMAQSSWFEALNSPLGLGLRQFSLSASRTAIVMALLWLAMAPQVSISIALLLLALLTIPQWADGLALWWQYGGEFSAILLLPLLGKGCPEKLSTWGVALSCALVLLLAIGMFTEAPLVMPPEAGGSQDAFFPLPQGGWPAIVMALIATGAGLAEKTIAGPKAALGMICTIRLLLWLLVAAITMPVFWQEPVTLTQVREGQEIFDSGECSDCHSYQTGFRGAPRELPRLPSLRPLVDLTFVHKKFTRKSMLEYLAGNPPSGMKPHKPPYDEVFTESELRQLAEFLLYIRALPSESGIDAE